METLIYFPVISSQLRPASLPVGGPTTSMCKVVDVTVIQMERWLIMPVPYILNVSKVTMGKDSE